MSDGAVFALAIVVYLAVGAYTAWLHWTSPYCFRVTLFDLLIPAAFWPICLPFLILIDIKVPSYAEVQQRRREAREKRQQPTEAVPAGKEKR